MRLVHLFVATSYYKAVMVPVKDTSVVEFAVRSSDLNGIDVEQPTDAKVQAVVFCPIVPYRSRYVDVYIAVCDDPNVFIRGNQLVYVESDCGK